MRTVLKFGGTSVGSAENMRRVASIICDRKASITVLSAMSGTTDTLVRIAQVASNEDAESEIEALVSPLEKKYLTCVDELLSAKKEEAREIVRATFAEIRSECCKFDPLYSERFLVSRGELMTSAIFTLYMREAGYNAVLLNAPDLVRLDEQRRVDTRLLGSLLSDMQYGDGTFYITQGFICTDHLGRIDNLGRGGSDFSAALMGAAIKADRVEIWTDIDGMHNNDPRYVENTYALRKISFDEAAELAYFGAKILHPATIQPCKDLHIPVLLKNTMEPDAEGTIISEEEDMSRVFHAVAAKDGITVIRIYSARMLMAYGFLRKVFEVFEHNLTPIDMITTSEVAVSITIDNDANLPEITAGLEELGTVEIERDNTIVCIVGHIEHHKNGLAAKVMEGIGEVPLKMISYGASHRSIAMLVDTRYKKEILQSLNNALFTVG